MAMLIYIPLLKTSNRFGALIHKNIENVWGRGMFLGLDESRPPFLVENLVAV
jgi:hypothetical protein